MNLLDTLRRMVAAYPGGIEVMAVRLGKTTEVLRKELAGNPSFKLGLLTAMEISDYCREVKAAGCMDLVNAVTASSGGFIRLPVVEMAETVNLQRTMCDVIREMSDVSVATIEGDSDDVISDNDLKRSLKEIEEARTALQVHEMHLIAKNAAGKPALRAVA